MVDEPLHGRHAEIHVGGDERPLQYLEVFLHRRSFRASSMRWVSAARSLT